MRIGFKCIDLMKLFTFLAAFLPLSLTAQIGTGPSVRQTNSSATGLTLHGSTTFPGGSSVNSAGVYTGNGGGLSNVIGNPGVVYVSTTGVDSGNTNGTIEAPFLTMSNAIAKLNGSGTIVVRGGDYFNQSVNLTNAGIITLTSYAAEVPKFWFGFPLLTGAFTPLSNGIHTVTLTAGELAALTYLTNMSFAENSEDMCLFQTNVPFGTNIPGSYSIPPLISRAAASNRCEHYLLRRAQTIPLMVNSNALWQVQGSTLYIKFAVSNAIGGIYIPATNIYDAVCYGGTTNTNLRVQGIRTYFGYNGFDYNGVSTAEFDGCYSFGSGRSGFYAHGTLHNSFVGSVRLLNCESAGAQRIGSECVGGLNSNRPFTRYYEEGCYWHDYRKFGSLAGFSISGNILNTLAVSPQPSGGKFGFICDASTMRYLNCTTYSNASAGFQIGDAAVLGTKSFIQLSNCKMGLDLLAVQINDRNNIVILDNCIFEARGSSPVQINDASAHYVRLSGCVNININSQNSAMVGGSTAGSTIVQDMVGFGPTSLIRPGSIWVTGSDAIGAGVSIYLAGTFTVTAAGDIAARNLNLTGGMSTLRSNKLAPTAITFPATTVPWTNNQTCNIELYIDNTGVTGSVLTKNGTTIASGLVTFLTLGLQPGEYFSETYTVGTPTARWSPQ